MFVRPMVAVVLAATLLLAVACSRTPPEERLRQQLEQLQQAVEERRGGAFMDVVAEDFVGNGGMDRAGLERMLKGYLLLNPNVGVTRGPAEVQLHGDDRASVSFTALLTGGSGRLMPERGRMQSIDTQWREVDGEWQVYRASWRDAAGR